MKHFLTVGLIVMTLVGTSCKKNYNCECKLDKYIGHSITNVSTEVKDVNAKNNTRAAKDCASNNYNNVDAEGNGIITRCELK